MLYAVSKFFAPASHGESYPFISSWTARVQRLSAQGLQKEAEVVAACQEALIAPDSLEHEHLQKDWKHYAIWLASHGFSNAAEEVRRCLRDLVEYRTLRAA
jgi:hypothetical protein